MTGAVSNALGLTCDRRHPPRRDFNPLEIIDNMDSVSGAKIPQSVDHAKRAGNLESLLRRWLLRLPLLACVGLFLFHFFIIQKYAVNIPNMDDWALFAGDNHPASVDLPWLYAQHNEHRTATTKLFVWMQFQLNGWNVRTHQLIDFIIYGLFLTLLVCFGRKCFPKVSSWIGLSFIVFLLSPIIWLDHFMAYPVAVHFWLLFFIISSYFLFTELQDWLALVIGCLASILSIYSFAAGVITSFILLTAFCLFKSLRAYKVSGKKERTRELLQLLLVVGFIGGALATWMIGYRKPGYHPPLAIPYTWTFWRFFFNIISFGFGVDSISVVLGAACFFIVLFPIFGEIWKRRGTLSTGQWAAFAAVMGILADLAAISMGRAGFGFGVWVSKTQEYAEHGMPLIILSVLNWNSFLKDRKRVRVGFTIFLWLFCFVAFSNNWHFDTYKYASVDRKAGARCVKAYYEQTGDGRCPNIYPANPSFRIFLEQARKLNASFYQAPASAYQDARVVALKEQKAAATPFAGATYFGTLDIADCEHIFGWVWDGSRPAAAIDIDIYDEDRLLATVTADFFRADVFQAGFGTGLYGFDYPPPSVLKDGRPHLIHVKFAGTTRDLTNSPKPVVCASP